MKTVIQNGLVVDSTCSTFLPLDVVICGGIIEKLIPRGTPVAGETQTVDGTGKYILPGLIDIHNHGGMGVDFGKDDDFSPALDFYAKQGVTTVLPTIGARPMDQLLSSIKNVLREQERSRGARIGGIHLEGPFISEKKKGALRKPDLPCTVENFSTLFAAAEGQLRVMTIAPERENALEVIGFGAKNGVRMSIGHTDATCEQAMAAIQAGATGATHTFNAMRSFVHRDPGVLGAVLTDPRIVCEAICDMVHLSPATVKLILAAKGVDHTILISDGGCFVGLGDGDYMVDTSMVTMVRNGVARRADGTIDGSCCTMAEDARKLIDLGYSLLDIAKIGAFNPAQATGLTDRGQVREGLLADLIITDAAMHVSSVILRGECVYSEV